MESIPSQEQQKQEHQQRVQKIREWLELKNIADCGLCSEGTYDVERFRTVFVPTASMGVKIGAERQRASTVPRRPDKVMEMIQEVASNFRFFKDTPTRSL